MRAGTARARAILALLLCAVAPRALAGGPPEDRLPDRAERRYRMEMAGEPVGVAVLRLKCAADRCRAWFETEARLPEAGGGGIARRRTEAVTDRDGRAVPPEPADGSGAPPGPVASLLAEAVLARAREGERRCIEVVDVESRRAGPACATRRGAWLTGEILGEPARFRARAGRLPDEVILPAQGTRFVADREASIPPRAPGALGTEVPSPPGAGEERALHFCGLPPAPEDPEPPPRGVPRDFAEDGSCREKTAAYLSAARRDGVQGRHVVGVAWDGSRFVWHEWAEVAVGGRWVPVDPSFRQVPAAAPRFAVARFADGDDASRAEAGRRVLACWGRARVERAAPAPP